MKHQWLFLTQVIGTLEFARELTTQFKTMAVDEEKARKKQLKKENQERHITEIKKIASTLEIKVTCSFFGSPIKSPATK